LELELDAEATDGETRSVGVDRSRSCLCERSGTAVAGILYTRTADIGERVRDVAGRANKGSVGQVLQVKVEVSTRPEAVTRSWIVVQIEVQNGGGGSE